MPKQPPPVGGWRHKYRDFTSEHRSWSMMWQRCDNPKASGWLNYGGRGISVCLEWASFDTFIDDMGRKPEIGYSLDRIDVNGNYEPSNCRWATPLEQGQNRRNNHLVVYRGQEMTVSECARKSGIPECTLSWRLLKGWDVEEAVTTPCAKCDDVVITFRGESRNISQWEKHLGLAAGLLWDRLFTRKMPLEKALTQGNLNQRREVTFNGKTQTVTEWEKEMGFKKGVLWARLYTHKMSVTKAMTTPYSPRSNPR